jgi:tetratricopeptide (TPR) repeat protein
MRSIILAVAVGSIAAMGSIDMALPLLAQTESARDPADSHSYGLLEDRCTDFLDEGEPGSRDLAEAFTTRGFGYKQGGQYDRALEDFNRAILLDPTYLPAYYQRALLYRDRGDFDRARRDFDKITD